MAKNVVSVPGPRSIPLLGPNGNVARFAMNPLRYVGRLFERYGPIAALVQGRRARLVSPSPSVPGVVFVHGPELNRVLLTGHEQFHKSALAGRLYPIGRPRPRTRPLTRLLTGLFHVNDDAHRQQRRLLMPAFHKSRIDSYRDDMVAITESVLAGYREGAVRDLKPDMMELTLRVATKTLFGADMGEAGLVIGRDLQRWLELLRPAAVLPLDLPSLPYRRWLDLSHRIDRQMAELVARKRSSALAGSDMLSMLLQATDAEGQRLDEDELIGHAGVIFAAGHETSSNALCWTLLLLSQHPQLMDDLRDELAGQLRGAAARVDQLAALPLLDGVVKESLRLFPPAPLNHRLAARDCELGGYTLQAGTEVLSSIYHTHRIAEIYPEPNRFLPRRWERFDPGPYAYCPFSAGPRMCIGAMFALMEIKVVLSIMLQRFRFELAEGARIDRHLSITMAPKQGLRMRLWAPDRRLPRPGARVRGDVQEMVEFAPA
jgi:cytochrome P450